MSEPAIPAEDPSFLKNRVFLVEADDRFRIRYVSDSVQAISGYSPRELLDRPLDIFFARSDSEAEVIRELRPLLAGTVSECRFETICQHRNGSDLPVEILAYGVAGKWNPAVRLSITDLSLRKSVETQLRLSDEILNTINTMVLVANGEGHIIYVSPCVTRILGYPSAEVLGLGWWMKTISDNEVRRNASERIARCARGDTVPPTGNWEEELLDKDGVSHWFLWQGAKGPDDLFIGVAQEITRRKEMEDALEQSSRQLRAIFESALEGLLILDDDLLYVDANPAACTLIGRSRAEIIGKRAGSFSSDPEAALERFKNLLSGTASFGEGELRAPDGTIRNIEYSVAASVLPRRHLVVTRNVSERKRLEAQLLQAQKMEAVGQLAGGVAHDFNNMLTVIRGYSELLQRGLEPNSPQRRFADTILSATEKATMTTQQLLAFSRQQVIQPRNLNLNLAIHDTGKLLHRLIGEDIKIRFDLADELGVVLVDPGQLNQILLNLAINARDAMPNGGTLTIETSNVTLDEDYARGHLKVARGDYVMLTVTDTGCGMTPETISRIFEPFFTTKPAGKGTGLGLSTVYGIVEQANGAIYVYSEVGEGTSFKIYLPRLDRPQSEETKVESMSRNESGASILLIDDDEETCRITRRFLEEHGYIVVCAHSGGEALQKCESMVSHPAIVVSDVTMPGADGHDIQGYLAIHHPNARMIYISGYPKATLRDRGVLPRDSEFLQKPFRMEELLQRIRDISSSESTVSNWEMRTQP